MESKTPISVEVPSALPEFEDDDAREKLLLDGTSDELEDAIDEEAIELEKPPDKPPKRRWRVLRALAGFGVFLGVLVIGVTWFFGIGWFSGPQVHAVNRSAQRDTPASPATEDEKLKMALNMVAPPTAVGRENATVLADSDAVARNEEDPFIAAEPRSTPPSTGFDQDRTTQIGVRELYSLPQASEAPSSNARLSGGSQVAAAAGTDPRGPSPPEPGEPDDARGRSLFFGITKSTAGENGTRKAEAPQIAKPESPDAVPPARIPFGTLLPVRLVGSIYTLRDSGGFVRMELTRAVEGKGYSFPAGTMIVGNVRGGGSVRAFVNVVGLIDPVSGELVRFSGEFLGRDGASGIEGRRRNLTSQWARFFRGMKDTAASVLGSVGAIRSGGTVILSEPLRRGTESMAGDLSGAILKNERVDTFLEVAAGSNGYVLVTGLPENSTSPASRTTPEAAKE